MDKLHLGVNEQIKNATKEKEFQRNTIYYTPNISHNYDNKPKSQRENSMPQEIKDFEIRKLKPDTGGVEGPQHTELSKQASKEDNGEKLAKVLLVEDTPYNLLAIKMTIEKSKLCTYDVAENGLMAYEYFKNSFKKGQYKVIFMDLEMPIMDGYEATRRIRAYERKNNLSRVRICGLSANEDTETINNCKNCGMDDFLTKPISMGKLLAFLK